MSTAQIWQTESISLKDTLELAKVIGSRLRGGESIVLVSDLGGGKTAFIRGVASGMGSKDIVRSPSFTLNNQYRSDKFTLYHFDFYRLSEPGIMKDELAEVLSDPRAVVAVEWPAIVEEVLPAERLTININATGETSRKIIIDYPQSLNYLLPVYT